jgi:hypothetical protein
MKKKSGVLQAIFHWGPPWKPACSPSFSVFAFPCFSIWSFLRGLLLARLVCSDSSASVVYPVTSFTDAFDQSMHALILRLFTTLWRPPRTLSTDQSVPVLKSSECLRSFKCLDDCGLGGSQQSISQIHEHITRVFVSGHLYQERIATLAIQLDFGERRISITWKWLLLNWSFP